MAVMEIFGRVCSSRESTVMTGPHMKLNKKTKKMFKGCFVSDMIN